MSATTHIDGGWYVVAWHYPSRPTVWGVSRDEHGRGAEFMRDDSGAKRTFQTERQALDAILAASQPPGAATPKGGE